MDRGNPCVGLVDVHMSGWILDSGEMARVSIGDIVGFAIECSVRTALPVDKREMALSPGRSPGEYDISATIPDVQPRTVTLDFGIKAFGERFRLDQFWPALRVGEHVRFAGSLLVSPIQSEFALEGRVGALDLWQQWKILRIRQRRDGDASGVLTDDVAHTVESKLSPPSPRYLLTCELMN